MAPRILFVFTSADKTLTGDQTVRPYFHIVSSRLIPD